MFQRLLKNIFWSKIFWKNVKIPLQYLEHEPLNVWKVIVGITYGKILLSLKYRTVEKIYIILQFQYFSKAFFFLFTNHKSDIFHFVSFPHCGSPVELFPFAVFPLYLPILGSKSSSLVASWLVFVKCLCWLITRYFPTFKETKHFIEPKLGVFVRLFPIYATVCDHQDIYEMHLPGIHWYFPLSFQEGHFIVG